MVFPFLFCKVECPVGIGPQRMKILSVFWVEADAHRYIDGALKIELFLIISPFVEKQFQRFCKPFFVYGRTGNIDDKFVPADPSVDFLRKCFQETLGNGDQNLVSEWMAVPVVVGFEIIDIHRDQNT